MCPFGRYAIAYLRVFDWTKDDVWRERAEAIYDWAWKYGWDHRSSEDNATCGGFWYLYLQGCWCPIILGITHRRLFTIL